MKQLELIPSSTAPLRGVEVKIEGTSVQPCCARSGTCTLGFGAGNGIHAAAIRCAGCGAFRGWLSKATAEKIEQIIKRFGRPEEPIALRR